MADKTPSPKADNGRNSDGTFAKGHGFAKGNPHHKAVGQLRSELLRAVTRKHLRAIVKALIEKAEGGDVLAAREVLNRVFGKAPQAIEIDGSLDTPMPIANLGEIVRQLTAQREAEPSEPEGNGRW